MPQTADIVVFVGKNNNKKETTMSKSAEVMENVAAQIIKSIESGIATGKWEKPWKGGSIATNAVTGKQYKGGNLIALWVLGEDFGSQFYATYKQWQSVDAQVRKGETGIKLVKWIEKKCRDHGDDVICNQCGRMIPSVFTVFNSTQVDGWSAPTGDVSEGDRIASAEEYLNGVGATIKHSDEGRAYYRSSDDSITMPHFEMFKTAEGYYGTLAHELVHWTGHESRLNRDLKNKFGSDAYAAEELVAELGSAMLCATLGVEQEPRPDHAEYLAHWVSILKNDYRTLWTAASKASKAVEFIDERAVLATREEVAS